MYNPANADGCRPILCSSMVYHHRLSGSSCCYRHFTYMQLDMHLEGATGSALVRIQTRTISPPLLRAHCTRQNSDQKPAHPTHRRKRVLPIPCPALPGLHRSFPASTTNSTASQKPRNFFLFASETSRFRRRRSRRRRRVVSLKEVRRRVERKEKIGSILY